MCNSSAGQLCQGLVHAHLGQVLLPLLLLHKLQRAPPAAAAVV
jgi:hypothetical protein